MFIRLATGGGGGGLVVSVLSFYSNDTTMNPLKPTDSFLEIFVWINHKRMDGL